MDQKAQAPHASPAPDAPPKPVLDYPFEAPPQRGQTLEVAPGVLWIRMPLPYALDHINLWAIDDGNGWAIVDTGARTDEGVATWRELFSKSSDGRSLTRVLVTHMHPDHVGLAGWLTRKFHVPLYMTRLEYLNCRVVVSDCSREAPPDAIAFYRRAGWSDGALESYRARFGNFGKHIHALPDSYRRLHDGEELGRSGAAAHLFQRLGPSHGARRQPHGRLDGIAGKGQARSARRCAGPACARRLLSRPACAHRFAGGRPGTRQRPAAGRTGRAAARR
jgi:hypothetical protein